MSDGRTLYSHDWSLSPEILSTPPWELFSKIWTAVNMTDGSAPYPHDWSLSPKILSASPWELFSKIWAAVTGYPARNFVFIPGSTPMSTAQETAIMILSYYLIILIGRKMMRGRPAFQLTSQFQMHNLFLSVLSGFLFLLFVEELGPGLWRRGIYHCICGPGGWTKRLVTLYYVRQYSHTAASNTAISFLSVH